MDRLRLIRCAWSMVLVRETAMDDWQVIRDVRLAALRDAPDAFGSTYAREEAFEEADWRSRIASGGNFLAYIPEVSASEPAGLIAAGAGWARARNATSVHLWVTETNKHARLLYQRCGFVLTGERGPLPSNPALAEVGMTRPL